MNIDSKVYLDLAEIWNVGPGEVEKMVRDYIGAVTCDFKPLKLYSKPRICIRPVKVKTLKERLEETKMKNDIYPLVVVLDRYNGTYSGGKWTAWNLSYVPSKIDADDTECADFFAKNMIVYGRGETPQEAIDDLTMILNCGISDPGEEDEDDDEEDEKMIPTSVWKFEDIDDIWMSQEGDKMSLELKNKDDLTQIILTGDAIKKHNDNFVTMLIDDYNKLLEEIEKLRLENEKFKKELHSLKQLKTPTIENFADEKPSTRADILDQAKKCVCGQREQDYGTPESNFQLIADLWNGYLGGKTDNPVISVTPVDVSMMMALLKIARIRNGGGSGDSFVDLAGYAACGGEIWAEERKSKDQK